jgi:hypothetical protein
MATVFRERCSALFGAQSHGVRCAGATAHGIIVLDRRSEPRTACPVPRVGFS